MPSERVQRCVHPLTDPLAPFLFESTKIYLNSNFQGVKQNRYIVIVIIIIVDHFVSLALANPTFISIIQDALCYIKCSLL